MTGRFDGIERELPDVLKELRTIQTTDTINNYYNPEIFENIMQAIEKGKGGGEVDSNLAKNVDDDVQKRVKKINKAS